MFVVYCVNIINQQQGNLDEIHALNEQLQDVNEQLQEYSVMAEKMAETRERNRLAREIHDTLGHTLTGIAAGIDACLATKMCIRDRVHPASRPTMPWAACCPLRS